jgi:hypothetical protein
VLACSVSTGCCGRFDRVQKRSRWLGFPLAVMRKFGDDNGGALTTVVAALAFFEVLVGDGLRGRVPI